jgi:tripartite-type tricarboxylate transporter receptor subunit TctC
MRPLKVIDTSFVGPLGADFTALTRIGKGNKKMKFITALFGVMFAATTAQAWPDQPVRMVVPFAAGGTTDVMARIVAEKLAARLGRPVLIENVSGSGGNSGAALVAKAAPDGYTILMASPGPVAMNQFMYGRMPYDTATAFAPIAYIASVPSVLVISPKIEASSVSGFVAEMKARSGGANFGSAGMGSTGHLGGALFVARTGLQAQHVPYRGSAPMLQDLLAGNIQFAIDTVPGVMSFIRSGSVKALAITGKTRSPALPDVQDNSEAGIPDVEISSWLALLAPAGTPPALVDRINAEADAALREPDLRQRIIGLGAVPEGGAPQDVAAFIRGETEKWKRVIAIAGVKVD